MANNGDSSIWRSLAVAFGDGVAFGVGMKLTQGPPRPTPGEARPEPGLADRVSQVEQRLEALLSAPAVPAAFDQRVLDAIVTAIETRVREHSTHVERRLADLDAKFAARLKGADGLRDEFFTEIEALRHRLDDERTALPAQIAAAIRRRRRAQAPVPRDHAPHRPTPPVPPHPPPYSSFLTDNRMMLQ